MPKKKIVRKQLKNPPSSHRRKWTASEIATLKKMWRDGASRDEMSKKLKRTPLTIGTKYYSLGFAEHKHKASKSAKSKKTVRSARKSLGVNKKTLHAAHTKPEQGRSVYVPPSSVIAHMDE